MSSSFAEKRSMMAFFDKKHGLITATVILLIFSLIVASAFLYFKKEKALPMKYEEYVYENAEAYHVPPEIIFAVIYAESSFRPQVVSKHGAMGLMQLMPAT
ncbi:MAG: transglycosylase SLT domain-containing protein, partial [Clostridia bacterium]|nr:transglycosylase SLT domain-containing protein [Clostridia bacterium]